MGYYTEYTFESDDLDNDALYVSLLEAWSGYTDLFEDQVKWYDHKDHMLQLSRQYPTVLFTLNGVGEARDDIWTLWVRGGKAYKEYAKIVYPTFDEEMLGKL